MLAILFSFLGCFFLRNSWLTYRKPGENISTSTFTEADNFFDSGKQQQYFIQYSNLNINEIGLTVGFTVASSDSPSSIFESPQLIHKNEIDGLVQERRNSGLLAARQ